MSKECHECKHFDAWEEYGEQFEDCKMRLSDIAKTVPAVSRFNQWNARLEELYDGRMPKGFANKCHYYEKPE